MDNATLSTCLLWLPALTVCYLPFAKSAVSISTIIDNSGKRGMFYIWDSLSVSQREEISALQYNLIPLPDTWLEYMYGTNVFREGGLMTTINNILEIHVNQPVCDNVNFMRDFTARHFSMIHPDTPLCLPSAYRDKHYYCSLLHFSPTFKCHCKQYIYGDIQHLEMDQITNEKVYLVDLESVNSPVMFDVDVMQCDGYFTNLHTTIKITRCVEKTI